MEELVLPVKAGVSLGSVLRSDNGKNIWLVFVSAEVNGDVPLHLHVHGDAAWVLPEEMKNYTFCPADQAFLNRNPLA